MILSRCVLTGAMAAGVNLQQNLSNRTEQVNVVFRVLWSLAFNSAKPD